MIFEEIMAGVEGDEDLGDDADDLGDVVLLETGGEVVKAHWMRVVDVVRLGLVCGIGDGLSLGAVKINRQKYRVKSECLNYQLE